VSALAHYFESAGLPTTVLALVREHAAAIRPPRTLWVTFELGRPMGAPEDAGFQRRVLSAALGLLDRPEGPVLEDYPEDAPADGGAAAEDEGWVCPVSFAPPEAATPATHAERLAAEIAQMRPWHETWKRRRGSSGFGVAGIEVEAVGDFLGAFADDGPPASPIADTSVADALKLLVGDLMTFYQEAANAQPGATGSSKEVSDWFWSQTEAGKTLLAVRERGMSSEDPRLARVAGGMILPHIARETAP